MAQRPDDLTAAAPSCCEARLAVPGASVPPPGRFCIPLQKRCHRDRGLRDHALGDEVTVAMCFDAGVQARLCSGARYTRRHIGRLPTMPARPAKRSAQVRARQWNKA